MKFIENEDQLRRNIGTLESYLTEGNDYEIKKATLLVKRGTCFIAYKIDKEIRFAPSRFIGYFDNKLEKHLVALDKDGKETNKVINQILKTKPLSEVKLNELYLDYCNKLGIKPNKKGSFGTPRKFWKLNIEREFDRNLEMAGEFPEGRLVERAHKARERNNQLISLAKKKFKKTHGRLYCQICGFDFENEYGKIGKDFIEGHHTIAVSDMTSDHKTKIEEIAMLCSNCHRMIHKKRPWLTITDLDKLLKTKKW